MSFGLARWARRAESHCVMIKNLLVNRGRLKLKWQPMKKMYGQCLPGSCLVEVNSWKSEQVAGLYSIRGKRAFFFRSPTQIGQEWPGTPNDDSSRG